MSGGAARACFITGTDTGVGKTILTATIAAGLVRSGVAVRVRKPILTGISGERPADAVALANLADLGDDELLAAISGESVSDVAGVVYEPAVSPHLAAELTGIPLDMAGIIDRLRDTAGRAQALVVEGVGGLLVPLAEGWDVRGLAAALGWPVVIAARPGLGTLNHTLLTLEGARSAGLDVRAVVLTPWPAEPDEIELSNRATIEQLGEVEVATLPALRAITLEALADASVGLPFERWLDG
jgi:dethiobiotin synthetase